VGSGGAPSAGLWAGAPLMSRMDFEDREWRANGSSSAHPPRNGRNSKFYSAASLKDKPVPSREWLVPGLVPMRQVTLFNGDGGTGKSLLALQLAAAAASGSEWLGRWVRTGRVIFLSAEDEDEELHRRLFDILVSSGRSYDDFEGLTLRSLAGEDALLAVDTQLALMATELFAELEARAADEQPTLIVIDTLADVYPANENDRAKVRQFVNILRGLAMRQRCAVVLLGHPSLTGLTSGTGTSGSTAWNNSVRSRLYLSRVVVEAYEADPDRRVLTTKKANYGRVGEEIGLTWRAGVFIADEKPSSFEEMTVGAKAERVFLSLLDQYTAEGRFVSANPSVNYAPLVFASHQGAEGCTKRAFVTAMNALFARGDIAVVEHKVDRKLRTHIARAKPSPPSLQP
jgi:RecA-family ATPase